MTESKTLKIPPLTHTEHGLELPPEAQEFLTSIPYRKFMTKFEIGSNKLEFWGQPLVMMRRSELIKSIINKEPPYVLLDFGNVYEKPLIVLWLYLNHIIPDFSSKVMIAQLNLDEYLQLGRLINYFDVSPSDFTRLYPLTLSDVLSKTTEDEAKVVDTYKEQIAKMTNEMVAVMEGKSFVYKDIMVKLVDIIYKKYPKVMDMLQFVPMYNQDDKVVALFSRNLLNNPPAPIAYTLIGIEANAVRAKFIPPPHWDVKFLPTAIPVLYT